MQVLFHFYFSCTSPESKWWRVTTKRVIYVGLITSDFQVYGLRHTLGRRAGSHAPLAMSRTLQVKQQKGTKVTGSRTQQLPTTWHHFQSWWCPFLSIQSWVPQRLVLEMLLRQNVYVINVNFGVKNVFHQCECVCSDLEGNKLGAKAQTKK